ncbi:MAG: carboxypeptidase-like regulatory domain-containing protein [Bacteroidia bacterium]|nr:carboxypeptidase-like regulatory domain-containing protein [Bacteroidia bacterium]
MKKLILSICLIVLSSLLFAGNGNSDAEKNSTKLISGKVIDKSSGEEIAGAAIKIGDQIFYSDLNGNFSANVTVTKTEAEAAVSFISYQEAKVNINPFSYTPLVIELVQQ